MKIAKNSAKEAETASIRLRTATKNYPAQSLFGVDLAYGKEFRR